MLSPFFLAVLGAVAQASAGRVDTVRLPVSLELTEARTPVAAEFGVLTGLALDRAGDLYVADVDRAHIWVFDSAGRSRGTIGRKGEGPGEFTVPSGLAFDAQERLYVRDLVRVSRFRFDASRGLVARFDTAFRGPLYPNWHWGRASRFDRVGRFYYPRTVSRQSRGLPTQNFFYRYSAAGQLLDSLPVPTYDNEPATVFFATGPGSGRMLPGLGSVPFAPLPVWDATPAGTIISGSGRAYELIETDSVGTVLRRIRRFVPADPIDPRERADSVRALRARLDSLPVPRERVRGLPDEVAAVRVPDRYPAYQAVFAAPDGFLWVRRWPSGDRQRTLFDVFDRAGRLVRVVVLPRVILNDPTPVLLATVVVAAVADPVSGAVGVIRFGDARRQH